MRALAALALLVLVGCGTSRVLESDERGVALAPAPVIAWRPASAQDLAGFWESTEVTGSSAGGVLRAYYWFDAAGEYSGAALVLGEGRPRFVTIAEDGRWTLDDQGGLDLQDGSGKIRAEAAEGRLRLVSPESAIAFERVPLE